VQDDYDRDGPETEETKPGGFIVLNDDDDNNNGIPDKDENGPITNENDLVRIDLTRPLTCVDQQNLPINVLHPITLKAIAGGEKVKVWGNSTKEGTPITLPVSWTSRDSIPYYLWIEGVQLSLTPRDITLALEYMSPGGMFEDRINLTVIDVDITEPIGSLNAGRNPIGSWENSLCYHFDFQGIRQNQPGSYALTISGAISPASVFAYQWSLPSSCGTLNDYTIPSPTHTPPTSTGEGIMQLEALYTSTPTGVIETRKVKIYQDHLERDYANFETGGSCLDGWKVTTFNVNPQPVMTQWNCHGSTRHAYNGTYNSSNTGQPWLSWSVKIVVVTVHDSSGNGSHPDLGTLERGDVVAYFSPNGKPYNPPDIGDLSSWTMQHSQTCTSSGDETYGANNEPKSFPGAPGEGQSWKWATSPAGDWGIHIWQPAYQGSYVPFIIVVFDKP